MWPLVSLESIKSGVKGALVSGPFGSNIGSRFFVDDGVPVIRGNNLTLGRERFLDQGFVFVTESKARELKNCLAIRDDLVFTAAGTLGQVGLIPQGARFEKYVISNKQIRLRLDVNRCLPLFAYYYLSSPAMRAFIASQNKGSSVPLLTLGIIRKVPIHLPPLHVQLRIASVLSAYDDLIENNRRRIALLERMAEQLYREWFVRFRFLGYRRTKLEKSVPAGWHVRKLPTLAEIAYGFPFVGNRFNTDGLGRPIVRIRNVPTASTSDYTDEVVSDKYLIRSGDLLIGMDGEFHMNHWHGGEAYLVQRVCRIRPRKPELRAYLYWALRAPIKHLEATIVGATVAHLGAKHLNAIDLLVPEGAAQAALQPLNDLLDQKLALARINDQLAQTRDLLLPRLISGKLRVDDLDIRFPPSMQAERA